MICFLLDILLKTHSHMTCQNKSVHNVYKILVQITSGFSVTSWTSASWSLPKCFDIPRLNVVRFLLRCMKFIKPLRIPEVEVSGFMLGKDMFGPYKIILNPVLTDRQHLKVKQFVWVWGNSEVLLISVRLVSKRTKFHFKYKWSEVSDWFHHKANGFVVFFNIQKIPCRYNPHGLVWHQMWRFHCGKLLWEICTVHKYIYIYTHLERVAGECWLLCTYIYIYTYVHIYQHTIFTGKQPDIPQEVPTEKNPPTWSLPEASVAYQGDRSFSIIIYTQN